MPPRRQQRPSACQPWVHHEIYRLPTITTAAAPGARRGSAQISEVLAAEQTAAPAAQVTAVRAVNACFSAVVRATGFLVPREEAMVFLDAPGFRVTEVLVREGDRVTSGQILARMTRQAGEGPSRPRSPRRPPPPDDPPPGLHPDHRPDRSPQH